MDSMDPPPTVTPSSNIPGLRKAHCRNAEALAVPGIERKRFAVPEVLVELKKNPQDEIPYGTLNHMIVSGLAGSMCCGLTNLSVVPLDLIKCRMQVDPVKYPGMFHALRTTLKAEGVRTLTRGWAATGTGYAFQGFCKFGLYEVFKNHYAEMLGPENAYVYRTLLYLASASSAEAVADVFLAPFIGIKVRMQTSPGCPSQMRQVFPMVIRNEGLIGLYKGLPPLWMRQIPFTTAKFCCFEMSLEAMYKHVIPKKRDECTKREQLMVTLFAGIVAGAVAVTCSQPPDVIISKLYREPNATIPSVIKDLGFSGMWKGLVPRILMMGSLAAIQLFTFDSVKLAFKLERPPPPEMPESLKKKMAAQA